MSYFQQFPKISYPYEGKMVGDAKTQISNIECCDLMVRYRIKTDILLNPLSYYTYFWEDGQRPDQVANIYYGSTEYTWLVMFSGELFDWLHDIPMSERELQAYIEKQYGLTFTQAQSTIHHYIDRDGDVIDLGTFMTSGDEQARSVSIYEYEHDQNEARRQVKLLSRQYLTQISEEFEQSLKDLIQSRNESDTSAIL